MGEGRFARRDCVGHFGDKFRKEREKKGISLDDVSNVTKIGSRMLQAIEEEHFDQLPGGVFNKGFIRAYAKHLGLNDEEAVTDYLACLRQAQIDAQAVWEQPEIRTAPPASSPSRAVYTKPVLKPTLKKEPPAPGEELPELQLPRAEHVRPPRRDYMERRGPAIPWAILAAGALVIVLAISLWIRHSRNARNQTASALAPSPAPVIQSAPTPVIGSVPAGSAPASPPKRPSPSAGQAAQSTAPAATAHRTPSSPPNPPSSLESAAENDVSVRTPPPANPVPSPSTSASTPTGPLTLVIRASETSWISVTADGRPVSEETLIAPANTSIRASREIVARIGNAAGVTFLFNGQEIPAQGAEAEVKTFVFDAQGMRVLETPPPSAPPH